VCVGVGCCSASVFWANYDVALVCACAYVRACYLKSDSDQLFYVSQKKALNVDYIMKSVLKLSLFLLLCFVCAL
jgi:hypothetical protein